MIFHIEGPAKSGKSLIGNAMRNTRIGNDPKAGALLVDDSQDGEPIHLLEKLIAGDALTPGTPAEKIKWKNEPDIIFVGKKFDMLKEFEKLVPGITKKLGPVRTLTLTAK